MKVRVNRKAHFNAAHRLFNPAWDDAKNLAVFGKCSNPHFHGHNYEMIVSVLGDVDPITGYVVDMKWLKTIISEKVEDRYDHKNLNLEVEEFKDKNPTAENIVIEIWKILRKEIPENMELSITLYETPRNFVEFSG